MLMKNVTLTDQNISQLFSEFGRITLAKKRSSSNTMAPFQRIVCLIRDWPYPNKHSFGSQGDKDYIDDYLKISVGEEGAELGERRRQISRQIRQCFAKVDCYLMPKPGDKIETDESDKNSRLSGNNKLENH